MTNNPNHVRAYVPESLVGPNGLLLPDDLKVRHGVWEFLGLIYWKHLEKRIRWDEPVRLKYNYLYQNIPGWPDVWDWCESKGLVCRTGYYTKGKESYGYWTNLPYQDQTHRLVHFENKVLVRKRKKLEAESLSDDEVLKMLRQQLDRLSVDMASFNTRFGTHPDRHYYMAHLQTILDKQIRFTKDEFSGRIHTNVTNLYKPLRALLRVDGQVEPLVEIDIRNSQPLFLGIAALKAKVRDEKYLELCESGQLYEHLASLLSISRDSAKKAMMLSIFAKNGYRSAMKRLFTKEFPSIANYLTKIRTTDYKQASEQMQKAERNLIIDKVCNQLFKKSKGLFLTTVHDALLVQKRDSDFSISIMRNEFKKLGVNPGLRITILE